jgi:hypothetical protein
MGSVSAVQITRPFVHILPMFSKVGGGLQEGWKDGGIANPATALRTLQSIHARIPSRYALPVRCVLIPAFGLAKRVTLAGEYSKSTDGKCLIIRVIDQENKSKISNPG